MKGSSHRTSEGHSFHAEGNEALDKDVQLTELFQNISHTLNILLVGTGRSVTCDDVQKVITVNGGIELRGYGSATERHASSLAQLITPELLSSWGFSTQDVRKVQQVLMAICATLPEISAQGSQHEYSYGAITLNPSTIQNYAALSKRALQHVREINTVKVTAEELRAALASLVLRDGVGTVIPVDLRPGMTREEEFVDGTMVVRKRPTVVGGTVKPASPMEFNSDHVTAFMKRMDEAGLSSYSPDILQAVALERRVRAGNFVDEDDDDYGKTGNLLAALERARERIADLKHAYIEKTTPTAPTVIKDGTPVAVPIVNEGYTFNHLLMDERSVEKLRDEVVAMTERLNAKTLPKDMQPLLDAAHDAARTALDRSSADVYRFTPARMALIQAREALTLENMRRESVQEEIQAVFKPLQKGEQSIRNALLSLNENISTPSSVSTALSSSRYTGKEIVQIEKAVATMNDMNQLRQKRYTRVSDALDALRSKGFEDRNALEDSIAERCATIRAISEKPQERKEKAARAFEHLTQGVLETNSEHRILFTRSGDVVTFEIPTAIARVVQISKNPTQTHSGNYQSLQSAINYANESLVIPSRQIIGLEERASESFVDEALSRIDARPARIDSARQSYVSVRTKVKRTLAAMLGGMLGMTVTIPEAPRREPMHDVGTDSVRKLGNIAAPDAGGGVKVIIEPKDIPSERITSGDTPKQGAAEQRVERTELDGARVKINQAFISPVSPEHGTYALLTLLKKYIAESRALTPNERRAADWFTHALTRYVNESPETRIGQLTKGVLLPRSVIASTIPSRVNGQPVQLAFGEILQDKAFWEWFDAFYAKRKTTSLAQPGFAGLVESIDTVTARLKQSFDIRP